MASLWRLSTKNAREATQLAARLNASSVQAPSALFTRTQDQPSPFVRRRVNAGVRTHARTRLQSHAWLWR